MNKLLILIFVLGIGVLKVNAQTAKVYRAGALIGTFTTLATASAAASSIGDSILLSAHTFYEHNIPMKGGQIWQGTITVTDTSTIDAQNMGRVGIKPTTGITGRACVIRDVICTNGTTVGSSTKDGGGFYSVNDSLVLRGNTIIRNCFANRSGGAVYTYVFAYDKVKITQNRSDSFGGGVGQINVYDSVEISYNTSRYGGAIGFSSGGDIICSSPGVKIHHNTATVDGGAIYGEPNMTAGQIIYNQSPKGAALWTYRSGVVSYLQNCYLYNPLVGGKRQNELYAQGNIAIEGSWFGKSDTVGLTTIITSPFGSGVLGKYAIANWSVNRGKPLTKADTLFPIGAAFTYNDGTALPANALPWLVGNFSSSTGTMLSPKPTMSATDTLASLYRTYVYPTKGDTSSKFIDFLCYVDADTFRASPRVWGIDSISLDIKTHSITKQVKIYPNPASDVMTIQGAEKGDVLTLYDMQGRLMKYELLDGANVGINIAGLATGNYVLKIRSKDGSEGSTQLLKE